MKQKKEKETIRIKRLKKNCFEFVKFACFSSRKMSEDERIYWSVRQLGIVAIVNFVCEQFHYYEHWITIVIATALTGYRRNVSPIAFNYSLGSLVN